MVEIQVLLLLYLSFASSQDIPLSSEENATLYHYYPHNQHLFSLPSCASQQVCNTVYLRLNFSTPLCACPAEGDPCSASTLPDDGHSFRLKADNTGEVLTLAKTCEETRDIKYCSNTKDWSILALQNIRTGKAHYLVICQCPDSSFLEGPLAQTGAPYARVPGIRVYGMICLKKPFRRRGRVMNGFQECNKIINIWVTCRTQGKGNVILTTILMENFPTTPFPFPPFLTHPSSVKCKNKIYDLLLSKGFIIS